MRFLRHERERTPYTLHPPYPEERRKLLAKRPRVGAGGVEPAGRVWGAIVDLGLPHYLVSAFVFADGTVEIHASGGIHSTGLRGARVVAETGQLLLEEVEAALAEFSPVADAAAVPIPQTGGVQVIARTAEGDLVLEDATGRHHGRLGVLASMAMILADLARQAVFEGFEPVEDGDVVYGLAAEYRSMRRALLDWEPRDLPEDAPARVAGVAVEFGEGGAVTSLFAFADGSTSIYSSDGRISEGLSGRDGAARASRLLLAEVERALGAFAPAAVPPLPQPGRVSFVVRTRPEKMAEPVQLLASAAITELEADAHPLSRPFAVANEIRRIAGLTDPR